MEIYEEEHALGVVMSGGDGESRHSQQPRSAPARDGGGANTGPRPAPPPPTSPPPQRGS